MSDVLLEVRDLVAQFETRRGIVHAVDHVDFEVERGETLGLVGESGCGKSATGQAIMGLIQPPGRIVSGEIIFEGDDLLHHSAEDMRRIRGARISMIFQDPTTTLNPVLSIGEQIAELLRYHTRLGARAARERVIEMLDQVGLPRPAERYKDFPHEFSGGMQQRVIIACSLILHPALIIADEPTTALDVTVQMQILALLERLQQGESDSSIILISHDLGVIAQMCERVCVMYGGNIVEQGSAEQVLENPKHPYTVGLINAIPRLDRSQQALTPIPGMVADAARPPPGCKFHPRCARASDICRTERPAPRGVGDAHQAACHLYGETAP